MSVFGGDSWAREAQQRKRRVDDLLHDGIDSSSFKRLSNGRLTCLVCRNSPVFDSSLMLSVHSKGARHRAELSRLKQKELAKRDEFNKRIALSNDLISMDSPSSSTRMSICPAKPLVEQARKATSEMLFTKYVSENSGNEAEAKASHYLPKAQQTSYIEHKLFPDPRDTIEASQNPMDFHERREKELKFTAAGWKRDGLGRWYRDENVEFDSDEEDPNVVLG